MKLLITLLVFIPAIAFSQFESSATIYPNPATDAVSVKVVESNDPVMVKILSQEGKVLWSEFKDESEFKLDLRRYPQGTYYIQIGVNDKIEVQKLIIK